MENIFKILPRYRVIEANLDAKLKSRKGKLTKEEYTLNLKRHGVTSTIPDEEYKGCNTSIYHVCLIHNFRFKSQPSNIMNGYPCPLCNKEKVRIANEKKYKQKLKSKNINVLLDDEYVSHNKKIYHICLCCGNRWMTSPTYVLKNMFPCPECAKKITYKNKTKTQEQFEKEVLNIFGTTLNIVGVYKKSSGYIDVHCNVCNHNWSTIASNLTSGHGCPNCRNIKTANRHRKTIEKYREEVYSLHDDIRVVSNEYINVYTPILHECKKCGYNYYKTPATVLNGFGKCPLCNPAYELTENEFIELLNRSDKKIELLSMYNGKRNKITCRCLICDNIWTTNAYLILNYKSNCPNCSINERKQPILSNDEFVNRVHNAFPTIELLHEYKGCNNSMDCHCMICNYNWTVKSAYKLFYNGCPNCNSSKLESLTRKYLEENNIVNYVAKYQDLRGVNGGLLSYDFYLPQYNILIECQGAQHEHPVEYFGGKKKFIIQQIHDIRKRMYAKNNNIKLITIWHDQINDIPNILNNYLNNLKLESVETATSA